MTEDELKEMLKGWWEKRPKHHKKCNYRKHMFNNCNCPMGQGFRDEYHPRDTTDDMKIRLGYKLLSYYSQKSDQDGLDWSFKN